jgi:hypothetical protein
MRTIASGFRTGVLTSDTNMNAQKFWANLVRDGECLLWGKRELRRRYGSVSYNGKVWQTHRLAYTLTKGEIPPGMYVCHTCDRPRCCNPEHLFLGTQDDNMKDMVSKGRASRDTGAKGDEHWARRFPEKIQVKGSGNPMAKLTEEKVRMIRSMAEQGMMHKDIGREFDLHPETVGCIVRRKAWRHVA